MKLVSISTIPGKEIEALGIVKGTIVQSKNIGRDFMAGMKTIVGGEIKGYTEMLNEARQIATKRMVDEAEASRAMIARTVAERLNLKPAVFADERVVVFCKKLLLRISHLRIFFSIYYATKKAFCQVFSLTFRHDCAKLQV